MSARNVLGNSICMRSSAFKIVRNQHFQTVIMFAKIVKLHALTVKEILTYNAHSYLNSFLFYKYIT